MKLTITCIELKGPFKLVAFFAATSRVLKQLKATNFVDFKSKVGWTKHYTMTLWKTEEDLKKFATSGAHLEVMKESRKIATEVRTATIEADEMMDWDGAKLILLTKGKVISFKTIANNG
ncbi:MAG: DUF3291 domain-containing protein [Bacteroidetes bacterium]|nr:DUF3291 domain-containing protein [Bacteroidota bacterium]